MLRLKTNNAPFPPKPGWEFVDARTGKVYDGMGNNPPQIAKAVASDRKMNPRLYPLTEPQWFNIPYIIQEIYQQVAVRQPGLFVDSSSVVRAPAQPATPPKPSKPCPACGSFEAAMIYCATCGSGQKITGWKCLKCNKRRGV